MVSHRLNKSMIGILLAVGSLALAGSEEYRIFKSSNGREITASIIGYDTDARGVELDLKGGKRGMIPLSSLSPEDQAYVREWYMNRACFLSDDLFRIKLTEDDDGWKEHLGTQEERFTDFIIRLHNRGETDLDNIRIVCCEIRDKDGARTYSHYNLETTIVLAGEKAEETKILRSFRNEPRRILDSVIGVRIRLYWTSPDGSEIMREISAPKGLSADNYPWRDPDNSLASENPVHIDEPYRQAHFLSNDLFEIKLTEDDGRWEDYLGTVDARYTRLVFGLFNHGDADLNNIRVVCCEIRDKDGDTTYSHSNLETTKVRAGDWVEEAKVLFSRRNKPRKTINSVIGVRMRVYWTTPEGRELMREISAPKDLSADKYPWKNPEPERPNEGQTESLPTTASISDVCTKEKEHTTKKRGTYKAQTFEHTYTISTCKSYRIKSYIEFKDHRDKVTFLSSQSYHSKGPSKQATIRTVLHIDAEEHGLNDAELNAYWIQIYATDESGESHLVTEAHDGCSSLEELTERNDPPIGV